MTTLEELDRLKQRVDAEAAAARQAIHSMQAEVQSIKQDLAARRDPARLAQLALTYHQTVEGEYGCPGLECPGVQRLITLLKQV